MRKALTLYLLFLTVLTAGCMRREHRHVQEVVLTLDDTTREGSRSEVIKFHRDKGAEQHVRLIEDAGKKDLNRLGVMSANKFEQLVNAIEENDFYSKKDFIRDSFNGADLTTITVTADEGTHKIIADHRDPQIQNIMIAIQKASGAISWRPVDPK